MRDIYARCKRVDKSWNYSKCHRPYAYDFISLKNDCPYDLKEAARIIIRVAVALEHSHSRGIIHRGIKPSNIMIWRNNVVTVTDFGITKSSDGPDITWVLVLHRVRRNYMSPEQARVMKDIDGRSDIYFLVVVFY